jgi:hypothetical protein
MNWRTVTVLLLVSSTFVGAVLGFSNGMVLVVHDDGHVGLERALVRHSHEHAAGADHGPHDYTPDAEHAALHAAIAADSDACPPRPAQQLAGHAGKRIVDLPALPVAPALNDPLSTPPLTFMRSDAVRGSTAPAENARLRTVILVI